MNFRTIVTSNRVCEHQASASLVFPATVTIGIIKPAPAARDGSGFKTEIYSNH